MHKGVPTVIYQHENSCNSCIVINYREIAPATFPRKECYIAITQVY
ncbi:MAG: hypothetical protein O4805_17185 [Trichodesmium sp. St16_bin2-tuft]|nr:hypothetical protein [Trichodesmium sp. St16_bin2-tuft]MDE5120641.1 hypothetical protein [Trichodesmium sp. St19_bin1]